MPLVGGLRRRWILFGLQMVLQCLMGASFIGILVKEMSGRWQFRFGAGVSSDLANVYIRIVNLLGSIISMGLMDDFLGFLIQPWQLKGFAPIGSDQPLHVIEPNNSEIGGDDVCAR
ncbi:hypothetical protein VNO77_41835 [Canavalia gladiata]|uniref:Uncharacterized protein n=1 Tax=Canavalia gladiata TaxID=3824 RepID=A0AAN9K1A0_CANGL